MGKIVVLEGLDGCGKTTQVQKLKERLSRDGLRVDTIHFPYYDSVSGKFIKDVLFSDKDMGLYFNILLYAINRAEMKELLLKKASDNDILIVDRYVFSNMAYNIYNLRTEDEMENLINAIDTLEFDIIGLPRPDLILYLSVPISFVSKNLNERNNLDSNEMDIKKLSLIADAFEFIYNLYSKYNIIYCYIGDRVFSIEDITDMLLEKIYKILYH